MTGLRTAFLLTTAIGSTSLIASAASAQEIFTLDEITVSANREETALSRSGATVEVVTEDDLEAHSSQKFSDYAQSLPGVTMTSNGGLGTTTSLRIRGLGDAYVPVLFDGIELSDPSSTGNGFNWGGMIGLGISRAEILKGSQSARFGAGAVAGVVNLESWRPTQSGFSGKASLEYGSFNTLSEGLSLGFLNERTELSFSLSHVETDGFSAKSDNEEDDAFRGSQANFGVSHRLTDNILIGANLIAIDNYVEYDSGDIGNDYTDLEQRGGRLFTKFSTGSIDHELSFSTMTSERWDTGFTPYFKGERDNWTYEGYTQIGSSDLSFGIDYVEERSASDAIDSLGAFAEWAFDPNEDFDLVLSVRHDTSSKFDSESSGRLSMAWSPVEDLIVRAQFGTGYRFPSLLELGEYYGNPDFQPENSKSAELGIEHSLGRGDFIRATLFYTDINGKIDWNSNSTACPASSPTFPGCFDIQNFVSKGLELSSRLHLSESISVTSAYTYTHAETKDGERLQRQPKHELAFGVEAEFSDRLAGTLTLRHARDIEPSVYAPVGHKVGDYTVVDVTAAYELTDNVEGYLRIENLFDRDYEIAGGYNSSDRALYVGLRASF
ncbi:TonB-dependent receptor plug domain-containing protein [Pseudothioclava nitratireducens]|uniref:TonB-dependent receptor plug domain-containing protein n=1 Tax=Pseudothioclava nitratireducens TaxID=1928646 RepID=UPI0023DCB2BE|nr:TonB-dependent receptor [Defluviimonas nitratireducens]MDF1620612.1 TonB-dependent receptor [Defluviimonas nitratireducens]